MPLVRIDLPRSIGAEERASIGEIVYQPLADVFNVPAGDNFQIITAHYRGALRNDTTYLDINRSAAAFTVDITLNIGRTVELKKQFYATLVDRLNAEV